MKLLSNTYGVAAIFLCCALALTWPLGAHLSTEIAGDLGDPVFNCWVLMWTGGQVLRALSGDLSALSDFWNGNIFYPERLTVAYSEHLAPQMLQMLPVYAVTGNIVLSYNLLFLSTFVLAGVGTYLLVRELTGSAVAGFVAGLAFAFAPYRVAQIPHLQVLSAQWMPFAFYFARRYFNGRELRYALGAIAATVVQALSCGYYLFYFTPFIAVYGAWNFVKRRAAVTRRHAIILLAAAVAASVLLVVFLLPYLRVRAVAGIGTRPLSEVVEFSANVLAFGNAARNLSLFGGVLRAWPMAENEGFLGFTTLAVAIVGVIAWGLRRHLARLTIFSDIAFFLVSLLVAGLLALGPEIRVGEELIGTGPYAWFYSWLPGVDGLRVPARFIMVMAFFLSVLVGYGAATIASGRTLVRVALLPLIAAGILAEGAAYPLQTSVKNGAPHYHLTPRELPARSSLGAVYSAIRELPTGTVVAEFPYGDPQHDIRAAYFAGFHRKPILNGYSGFFPASFNARFNAIAWDPQDHQAALKTLLQAGVTHVVVHEDAYYENKGPAISGWLTELGARELTRQDADRLFAIR